MKSYPRPPFSVEKQPVPGTQHIMNPVPDCGEESYVGHGRLTGKVALITGADSGIGRAVAIAFAREGADLVISYLDEHEDAKATAEWIEKAGRQCLLIPGDIAEKEQCQAVVDKTIERFGRIDVLVNNAAFQMSHETLEEVADEEWVRTFDINITAIFRITKAALKHMPEGSSIINTSSVNSDKPKPTLVPYATTKGAIANFSAGMAQLLGERNIRVNSVAPGPIWTPLIVATMTEDDIKNFGSQTPLGRPGQPAELAPLYVLLASDDGSYISGARIGVTGGTPIL
ncbi:MULTISPECIES: glucose 1-dehydrogenase [Pseudomonas]|jgi:NAD(P)-dependent dehydrogenase (short-subunit alcohol dehydrogenase family)|uniref:Dehydrogenase n=1 Tax=Pseudomonas syringae TaxID=317 RepID=A0A085VKJ5_PSESX|nr:MULTISPECIES: glucose 1-dehydrogenase [Pseudomonas]EPJ87523.1 Short-chain dehydrogenase/reductase SDR [Pseudomonas sp. CFII64]KFE55958.1 dehydrogenase [Pseudomonas syringae]